MFRPAATSALALILGAAPVLADVTPAQVWENLRQSYTALGYEVSGAVEDAGGTLTVTDAVMTAAAEGTATTITVPRLTFQQTGDAKVRLVIDGEVGMESRFTVPAPPAPAPEAGGAGQPDTASPGSEAPATDPAPAPTPPETAQPETAQPETVETTVTGTLNAPGNETLVSGTLGDLLYEYSFPTLAFDIALPIDPASGATLPLSGTVSGVTGTQQSLTGKGTTTNFDMKAAEATITLAGDLPETPDSPAGRLDLEARMKGLSSAGSVSMPAGTVDLAADMAAALAQGFGVQADMGMTAMEARFDFSGKDAEGKAETAKGTVSAGVADVALQLSSRGLGYRGNVADTAVQMTASGLPVPVSYGARHTGFDMLIPVSQAEAAQPFKFAYSLEGLSVADEIWDLFDPNRQLPRDPASLSIDLSGDALVTGNLFDPAMTQPDPAAPPAAPFAPQTLTVNRIALDAVGAKADMSGSLDFKDNPEAPVGKLSGSFDGVNALMDKLVTMGLVPQDQMMGMRMMLAMFAKPEEGNPDRLTSDIEFREGGSIFANGQQVR